MAYHQSPAEMAQMERVNPQKGQGRPVIVKNGHSSRRNALMGNIKVSNRGIPAMNADASLILLFLKWVQVCL